ncbi:LuxR C-terminal-related transcriptional regulator [Amycolatopsis vancoresmycina]|uniref:LuxR family transcriptional regulator n=1 Tax=Amycolatopsis vancoresmycina DSM 44592 TaxID=1292037 RepID=R1FWS5_9PSEU|nr:LuxR C-terminal-related transcriptional regulator [Amycolatopsis vancoresmycina]EOD63807.1 LuxR family transcriptional regulator [Amycolatopsis vancoresmycina DSM 44592]
MPPAESGPPARLRVDAETTLILREAFHKIDANYRTDHYGLYDYARAVMSKIVPLDHFYVGFFHGANRVRYPYGYDSGLFTDPESHIYGPHGQAAWLLKHRQTYRMMYDSGAALHAGVPAGDTSRASADAVTTPLFRRGHDGVPVVFGMMSMQSYRPDTFDDNSVRAFEWLADLVARVLTKEAEDLDALRRLPAGVVDPPQLVTADHVVEFLSSRVADVRQRAQDALPSPDPAHLREALQRIVTDCQQLQSDLMELTLNIDNGPEERFRSLTAAEQGVAVLLASDLPNDRIARELGVSLHTVKSHVRGILAKYRMSGRAAVAEDVRKHLAR